jgi:hypothetical protein
MGAQVPFFLSLKKTVVHRLNKINQKAIKKNAGKHLG